MPPKRPAAASLCLWALAGIAALALACGEQTTKPVVGSPVPEAVRPLVVPTIGVASPLVAATAALMPGDVPPSLWQSVARRLGLVVLASKTGDILLGYDEPSRQFVRISDAMPQVIAAAIELGTTAGQSPHVYYVRVPSEGIVVGRIALAAGTRDEMVVGQAAELSVGLASDDPEAGTWLARTVGRQVRVATPQWTERTLLEQPKRKPPPSPMWVIQWGAVDVVEAMQRDGQPIANVDVDWDQWGTASALQLPGLARVLVMAKFVDVRGLAWSADGRWLLYRQWSHEICDPAAKGSLVVFDTLVGKASALAELAPDAGFGWLGGATVFFETPQGGRLLALSTNVDASGDPHAPEDLGLWPHLRWAVRWRAAACAPEP